MLELISKTKFKAKNLLPNATFLSHLSDKDHNEMANFAFCFRISEHAC